MISVIIINYFQKDLLHGCIRSVFEHFTPGRFEVIVVNNSPEENLEFIKGEFPQVMVMENKNRGFSQANNFGASVSNGSYLFFLNPDTLIRSDFADECLKLFGGVKNVGAVGLKLSYPDGRFQNSTGRFPSFMNEIYNKKVEKGFRSGNKKIISRVEKEFSTVREVDWATGAAIMIDKKAFNLVGGFDERFFLYYEDIDICRRLRNKGFTTVFFPNSSIIHLKGELVRPGFRKDLYIHSKYSQLLYYGIHKAIADNFFLRLYLSLKYFFISIFSFKGSYFTLLLTAIGIQKPEDAIRKLVENP